MWILVCTILGVLISFPIADIIVSITPDSGCGWHGIGATFFVGFFCVPLGFLCGFCIEIWKFCRADKKGKQKIIWFSIASLILIVWPLRYGLFNLIEGLFIDKPRAILLSFQRNSIHGLDLTVHRTFLNKGRGFGTPVGNIAEDRLGNIYVTYPIYSHMNSVEVNGIDVGPIAKLRPDGLFDRAFSERLRSSCSNFCTASLEFLGELSDGQYLMGISGFRVIRIRHDGEIVTEGVDLKDQLSLSLLNKYKEEVAQRDIEGLSHPEIVDEVMSKAKHQRHFSFKGRAFTVLKLEDGSAFVGGDFVAKAGGKTWINIMKILPTGDLDMSFEVRTR